MTTRIAHEYPSPFRATLQDHMPSSHVTSCHQVCQDMEICALLSLDPRTFLRPYRSCPLALRHLPTPSHYFIRTRCCTSLLRCNPEHIIPRVNIMEPEVSVVESPVEQTPPAKGKKVRLACQRCRDRRIKVCGDESPYKPPCCLLT